MGGTDIKNNLTLPADCHPSRDLGPCPGWISLLASGVAGIYNRPMVSDCNRPLQGACGTHFGF